MDKEQRAAHARSLFHDPVFIEIMDGLEADALNMGVYAKATDNDARAAAMAEVRAIRALRSKLNAIIGEANRAPKGGIA